MRVCLQVFVAAVWVVIVADQLSAQVTSNFGYDLVWSVNNGDVRAFDEMGRTALAVPSPYVGVESFAVDGRRRIWTSHMYGEFSLFDPAASAWTPIDSVQPSAPGGPVAIDAAGRIYWAVGSEIRVYAPSGAPVSVLPTNYPVASMDIDAGGRIIAVVRIATASLGIVLLDGFLGSPGALLSFRPVTPLTYHVPAVRARAGGGYVAAGIVEPSIGATIENGVAFLDGTLSTVGGFVAQLPPVPGASYGPVSDALELPDGAFVTRHYHLGFPPQGAVAVFGGSPPAFETVRATYGESARAIALDGRGRIVLHAANTSGSTVRTRRLDRHLATVTESAFAISQYADSQGAGDPTGMRLAWIADPAGDFDGDGLSNAQEVQLGCDPLDPAHFPATVTPLGPMVQGQSVAYRLDAPLDAGRLYMHAWTTNLADRLPLTAFHPADWRVFGASPYLAGSPGVLDPAFLLSTSIANPWFVGTIGMLDAAGSATTSVNVPDAGLPPNLFRMRTLFFVIAGAPYPNDVSAISDAIVVPLL